MCTHIVILAQDDISSIDYRTNLPSGLPNISVDQTLDSIISLTEILQENSFHNSPLLVISSVWHMRPLQSGPCPSLSPPLVLSLCHTKLWGRAVCTLCCSHLWDLASALTTGLESLSSSSFLLVSLQPSAG